ncbi:MAG: hypothetical protein ACLFWD_08840 [Anaerolineales bacterium]
MTTIVRNWRQLRISIREMPDQAKRFDDELTKALYRYRFKLTELQAKPSRMDEEIWGEYESIVEEIRELLEATKGRLLQPSARLRELEEQWRSLLERQEALLALIERAMEAADFYNKMESAKADKRRRKASIDQMMKHLTKAKRSLIQAFHYVVLREKSGESVTDGSILLDLDQAIDYWEQDLLDIRAAENNGDADVEILLDHMEQLRQRVVEASEKAQAVREVERQMNELLALDGQVKRASEQSALFESELQRVIKNLRDKVPAYWAAAEWDLLEEALSFSRDYVDRNIGHVRSELYVIRKRAGGKTFRQRESAEKSSKHPVSLVQALKTYSERTAEDTYVDPDADSSVRYLYQEPAS